MALVPYRGIGGGGSGHHHGGGSSGCLYTVLELVVVALVIGALVQGGALENLARGMLTMSNHVVTAVRLVVGGLAVMAMMVGGVLAISPAHRRFGYEVALGGLVAIALAAIGPTIVGDVEHALPQTTIPQAAVVHGEPARL